MASPGRSGSPPNTLAATATAPTPASIVRPTTSRRLRLARSSIASCPRSTGGKEATTTVIEGLVAVALIGETDRAIAVS